MRRFEELKKYVINKERLRKRVKSNGRNVSYGWIDTRLLKYIHLLAQEEWLVYSFLCLTANENGVSWNQINYITKTLKMSATSIQKARDSLKGKGLIDFNKLGKFKNLMVYQVLELDSVFFEENFKVAGIKDEFRDTWYNRNNFKPEIENMIASLSRNISL